MRREKVRQLVRDVLAEAPRTHVTLRTISVNFDDRTISIDGRVVAIPDVEVFAFPILSGDAVFVAKGMERVG